MLVRVQRLAVTLTPASTLPESSSPCSSPLMLPWGRDDAGDVLVSFQWRFCYFSGITRPKDKETFPWKRQFLTHGSGVGRYREGHRGQSGSRGITWRIRPFCMVSRGRNGWGRASRIRIGFVARRLSLGVWSPSVSGAINAGDWWPGTWCSESLKEEEVGVWTLGWLVCICKAYSRPVYILFDILFHYGFS